MSQRRGFPRDAELTSPAMSFGSRGSTAEVESADEAPRLTVALRERREPPVVLDEPQDRGVVEWRTVDHSAPRVRTDQHRRHAETAALGRPHMVEPPAPFVIGPHERRAAPRLATSECRDQRPHERLAGCDSARRVLAAASRCDVGHRRQRPALEVLVVLIQIGDVTEQLPVAHDAQEVQKRDAYRLGAAVGSPIGADREARVVVLHVELPGDAALLEPVEDRREVAEALLRDPAAVTAIRSREPEEMVGHAAARRRGEEAVEQDVLARGAPVEGQVLRAIEAHDRALGILALDRRAADEPIHCPPRVLDSVCPGVVGKVRNRATTEPERPYAARPARRTRHRHTGCARDAVGTVERAEVVVEGVVLLHQHDEVLDRRGRCLLGGRGLDAGERCGEKRSKRGPAPHGRTSYTMTAGRSARRPDRVEAGSASTCTARPL